MAGGNRKRILDSSIELFNASGTIAITTNHIAKHLKISPGNLYFHFRNREAIVRELFAQLVQATYEAWDPKTNVPPREFLERSFEVFWTFRFFHREMYHLRRQDPELNRQWRQHMARSYRLLKQNYALWLESGHMRPLKDAWEMKALSDSVLLSSSAFLGFFESPEKPASRRSLKAGIDHVNRLLEPYFL